MKSIKIELIKKNRKFFKCRVNNYGAKLIIDENSIDLELGERELLVNDKSIKTKYGTDIIFELAEISKTANTTSKEIITFRHDKYNSLLVERCKNLGGRWDSENKVWVFSSIVENEVDELDELYNDKIVVVEIRTVADIYAEKDSIKFCGYPIAKATGRDSGATVCEGIAKINGNICSGGSVKNWTTIIRNESIFRLEMSENLIDKYIEDENNFIAKIKGV